MGKIKLYASECPDCGQEGWFEATDPASAFAQGVLAVEVPDAIIADWRETRKRLEELEQYFVEKVQPQIDAEYARQHEEWRRTHPEEGLYDNAVLAQLIIPPKKDDK